MTSTSEKTDEATRRRVSETYGKLPLSFIQNDGQMDERVRYYEKGAGHATYFTQKGVYLSLVGGRTSVPFADKRHCEERSDEAISKPKMQNSNSKTQNSKLSTFNFQLSTPQLVKLIPLGANKNPEIIAEGQQSGRVNYLIGNDPSRWKTNIPTYKTVVYRDMYKDIDIKFYGNNRQMEYDIIVKPGANPSRVQLVYKGIEGLRVVENGDLEISLKEGKLIQKRPYVYQDIGGKRVEREGKFRIQKNAVIARSTATKQSPAHEDEIASPGHALMSSTEALNDKQHVTRNSQLIYGFTVASYDKRYPLVIDPVIAYSTYLGGSGDDDGGNIAVDSTGNAYVTGLTYSSDFPTANAFDGSNAGSPDAFVTKIDNSSATAVALLSFTASANNDGNITLHWETATEVDNAGFNLYRSRLRDGEYKKINNALIPAQGDATAGANYSYEDTPPSKGTYFYKLEDVDTNGVSTMHGPEKVRVRK